MELTEAQYRLIEDCLPRQRGNVSLSNLQVLNAILYVAEQGCKWRGPPKRFGRWHTIYTRMSRWSRAGVWIGCSSVCSMLRLSVSKSRLYRWTAPQSRSIRMAPAR